MSGNMRLVLAVFAAFAAFAPLRGEVFELWPWKGGGVPSGSSRTGELPGRLTPLYVENAEVNGVPLKIEVSALDTDFTSLLAWLVRAFRPENLRVGSDAIRVAYQVGGNQVERWLLVNGGPGKPVTVIVIVAPEKLPPPEWPPELPALPPGATPGQVIRFPGKKAVYGSFRNAGGDPSLSSKELAAGLEVAGWRSVGGEAGQPDGGRGGIFLHDKPRRVLWAGYGSDGNAVFFSRPY